MQENGREWKEHVFCLEMKREQTPTRELGVEFPLSSCFLSKNKTKQKNVPYHVCVCVLFFLYKSRFLGGIVEDECVVRVCETRSVSCAPRAPSLPLLARSDGRCTVHSGGEERRGARARAVKERFN